MTLTLLPVEVPIDSLSDPTSRIITPQVISSYMAAAGDFLEAVRFYTSLSSAHLLILAFSVAVLSATSAEGVHVGCKP